MKWRHYASHKEHGEDWSCAARSEAQKYKIVQNCVRISGRRVPVVSAAETEFNSNHGPRIH